MRITKLVPLFAVAAFTVSAGAVPLSYSNWDTRPAGSYAPSTFSNDGDGSLLMQTFDNTSNGKVAVIFGTGGTMGTLSSLNDVSVAYYKSSDPATPAANQFAYRIQLTDGVTNNISLVWENNYNGSADVPTDSWQNLDLTNGNFWLYDGTTNHNGGVGRAPALVLHAVQQRAGPGAAGCVRQRRRGVHRVRRRREPVVQRRQQRHGPVHGQRGGARAGVRLAAGARGAGARAAAAEAGVEVRRVGRKSEIDATPRRDSPAGVFYLSVVGR